MKHNKTSIKELERENNVLPFFRNVAHLQRLNYLKRRDTTGILEKPNLKGYNSLVRRIDSELVPYKFINPYSTAGGISIFLGFCSTLSSLSVGYAVEQHYIENYHAIEEATKLGLLSATAMFCGGLIPFYFGCEMCDLGEGRAATKMFKKHQEKGSSYISDLTNQFNELEEGSRFILNRLKSKKEIPFSRQQGAINRTKIYNLESCLNGNIKTVEKYHQLLRKHHLK